VISHFFYSIPGKTGLHIRIPAGFPVLYGLNYVAKKASVKRPLAGIVRGAFQPYFGKRVKYRAPFLAGLKGSVLLGFFWKGQDPKNETEPVQGVFSFRIGTRE